MEKRIILRTLMACCTDCQAQKNHYQENKTSKRPMQDSQANDIPSYKKLIQTKIHVKTQNVWTGGKWILKKKLHHKFNWSINPTNFYQRFRRSKNLAPDFVDQVFGVLTKPNIFIVRSKSVTKLFSQRKHTTDSAKRVVLYNKVFLIPKSAQLQVSCQN